MRVGTFARRRRYSCSRTVARTGSRPPVRMGGDWSAGGRFHRQGLRHRDSARWPPQPVPGREDVVGRSARSSGVRVGFLSLIVIWACGRVGATLAQAPGATRGATAVVGQDPTAFRRLSAGKASTGAGDQRQLNRTPCAKANRGGFCVQAAATTQHHRRPGCAESSAQR